MRNCLSLREAAAISGTSPRAIYELCRLWPRAAVRLRTTAAKRYKKVEHATALIWKVLGVAERAFRRLNAPELLPVLYVGVTYRDGVAVTPLPKWVAA